MTRNSVKKVAFVASFPPRKCGIATFTSDLIRSVKSNGNGKFEPLVVAVANESHSYDDPVKFEIRQHVKNDYICAADYLNLSNVQIVSLQHEFGLFGGEAGSYIELFLH